MEPSQICGIVILYRPCEKELFINLQALVKQVKNIILIDNTENSEKDNEIEKKIKDIYPSDVDYVSLGENTGIAYAQNIGITKAIEKGFDYFILLDQDSEMSENLANTLLESFKALQKRGEKVACVGPKIINKDSQEEYKALINKGTLTDDYTEKDAIIASGTFISKEAIEDIGMMEAKLFIDLVDFEWCWRARSKGYRIFVDNHAFLYHRVGENNINLFGRYHLIISAPIRYYYQYRNYLRLIRRSYVPTYWKISELIKKLIEIFVIILMVPPRLKRLHFIFKGIIGGLKRD